MQDSNIAGNLPSAVALAYIGDAVHSLYIRTMLVKRGIARSGELNSLALEYVTAEKQAEAYEKIKDALTEDEAALFRRAFNSTHLNKPKHASGRSYRTATGLEAVLGMLSFTGNTARLRELMNMAYGESNTD